MRESRERPASLTLIGDSIRDVAKELRLDWHTVKALEQQYMREQLRRTGTPGPRVLGLESESS